MDYLQKEQAVVGKLLNSNLVQNQNRPRPPQPLQRDESTKKKLGLFLGKK